LNSIGGLFFEQKSSPKSPLTENPPRVLNPWRVEFTHPKNTIFLEKKTRNPPRVLNPWRVGFIHPKNTTILKTRPETLQGF
jgi:hypothetical protein